jgi:hypothetical protein
MTTNERREANPTPMQVTKALKSRKENRAAAKERISKLPHFERKDAELRVWALKNKFAHY